MLTIPPPTPNVERQRQFRERNPGYFNKYYARQKAAEKRAREAAQAAAIAAANARKADPTNPLPLMLPAPVESLAMAEVNALSASLKTDSVLAPVVVPARPAA